MYFSKRLIGPAILSKKSRHMSVIFQKINYTRQQEGNSITSLFSTDQPNAIFLTEIKKIKTDIMSPM
jgi:hypothetical protein